MSPGRAMLRIAALAATVSVVFFNASDNPRAQGRPTQASAAAADLEVLQIRPDFYMIAGVGGNIAVQTGSDGVVLVDTGSAAAADSVVAAVRKITPGPIRYIILTSADADHIGGNEAFLRAGEGSFNAIANYFPRNFILSGPVAILSAENVLKRMSAPTGQAQPTPFAAWPTETFEGARRYAYLNGEGIDVLHQPAAHTDGDSIVFFRRSDVIVAGDLFDTTRFPVIDVARGGSLQGTVNALNRIIELAIPSVPDVSREGGTTVIPGHGHLGDQFDILNYRDMLVIVRDHVQDLIKAGRTLEQIKAASPAKGFVGRYGSPSGSWTTDHFIEAVYRSLVGRKP
jgi:cyclase